MNFFAAVRYILASSTGEETLSDLAVDIIKEQILPPLLEEAEGEGMDAIEARDLVELYSDYTRGKHAKDFGRQAFSIFRKMGSFAGLDDDSIADMAQDFALYVLGRELWETFKTIDNGPESFAAWFNNAARLFAKWKARDKSRKLKRELGLHKRDEDDTSEVIENFEDIHQRRPDSPIELLTMRDVRRDLRKAIKKKFRDGVHLQMFDLWMDELAKIRYSGKLNLLNKVIKPMEDKTGLASGTLFAYSADIKKFMLKHFKDELGLDVRMRGIASVTDRVAYSEYRRSMAAWVLSGNPIVRMSLGL